MLDHQLVWLYRRHAISDPANIPIRFKGTRIGYDLKPRYNAASSEDIAIILNTGENYIEMIRWGLVPFWAKDTSIGYKMINAHMRDSLLA